MKEAAPPSPLPEDSGRPCAPGALEVVRRFVNTLNVERGEDAIGEPEALAAWLEERGLLPAGTILEAADVTRATALREALRASIGRNNGLELPADPAALEEAATRAGFRLTFGWAGESRLVPSATGLDGALGTLLAEVHRAELSGEWPRLKICPADSCRWAYYDRSKNSHSKWCSPKVCGNRDKVRRYRERAKASAATF